MKLVHPMWGKGIFIDYQLKLTLLHYLIFRPKNPSTSSSDYELPDIPGTKFPWMSLEGSPTDDINAPGPSNIEKSKTKRGKPDSNEDPNKLRKQKQNERAARSRAKKSETQKQQTKQKNAMAKANKRANRSTEQVEQDRRDLRERMTKLRKPNQTKVGVKDGLRSKEILEGKFEVPLLETTADAIGKMDIVCQYCGALKYVKETSTSCCSGGKVLPTPFPKPPDQLMELWTGNDAKARIFRENSRHINNAVCLSSLQVDERRFQGFAPTVVFQGRVQHRAGSILPAEGELPRFAQLYVYDPALESTQRFDNMVIPSNMSNAHKDLLREAVQIAQDEIHQHNPFVKDFKQIVEMPEDEFVEGKIVITAKTPINEHERRYNAPTNLQEVTILMSPGKHDLVLQKRGGGLQTISELNPKGMPLHFTLLFPYGTYGWNPDEIQAVGNKRISTREFYAFHLNVRKGENGDFLHRGLRLFQEWICTSWVAVEDQRLLYQSLNQKALRADSYKNVQQATEERMRDLAPREDGLYRDDHQRAPIGRKILASSFTGSPRWYNAKFQDGMAICREYHKPDFFVTMTCNPNWPEIKDDLLEGQSPQDRPDIVARIFKMKKDQLMKDLTAGHLLGEVVAHMSVTEFQKRGLPHEHILIINANHDRAVTPELVDSVVTAELPPSPDDVDDPVEKDRRSRLQQIVLTNMIHGPCGNANPRSPCMEGGRCSKGFPKEFVKKTTVDQESYYATYQRRSPEDGGRSAKLPKGDRSVDNSWVVPYNPYLSLRYNCHINVECCASPKATKYLFKYVTKGNDRAMVSAEVDGQARNEIVEYQDLRSVGSSEASWHLLNFPITERFPPVMALRVHLKDEQQVVFDANSEVVALENQRETELTSFFKYNEKCLAEGGDAAELPKYVDMPKTHVYDKSKKEWRIRKRGDTVIGRVHSVNPVAGESFYLRVLLHDDHCKGKISFQDMLSLTNGRQCETFQKVCFELGLLNDDREWHRILEDAAATSLCPQIREMFVIILIFCRPSDPLALFTEFWETWIDDLKQKGAQRNVSLSDNQLKTMVLLDIEMRLQSFEEDLCKHGLPKPTPEELADVESVVSIQPAIIREELDFDVERLAESVDDRASSFTPEQSAVFQVVMNAVKEDQAIQIFLDARGGCGKTYLLNTILSAVRSLDGGSTALAMATTGIAANLLELGRTFHSRLKAPLSPSEDSMLAISGQSNLAKLIRMSKLLLIDEATMLNRYLLEALDRSLRDIMGKPDKVFGDKIIILSGDFRQCLPVVPGSTRAGTVAQCVNQSLLWRNFQVLRLTQNMRVQASGDPVLEDFDKWTLSIGNGESSQVSVPEDMVVTKIIANSKENSQSEGQCMEEFIRKIFPNIEDNIHDKSWLEGRAVLCPTNKEVGMINEMISGILPGQQLTYSSADELQNTDDLLRFNVEYLNSLTPNGFPPHCLLLKPGMPLMLLRNLNPREGLCNGTKLIFEKSLENKVLQCVISGTSRTVLIPRIIFIPQNGEFPFEWRRRQFPVKPAFATTINKSQGI